MVHVPFPLLGKAGAASGVSLLLLVCAPVLNDRYSGLLVGMSQANKEVSPVNIRDVDSVGCSYYLKGV